MKQETLADLFKYKMRRENIFLAVKELATRYGDLTINHRQGRRQDDPYLPNSKPLHQVSYYSIKYSNAWRIFLDDSCTIDNAIEFRFVKNKLQPLLDEEKALILPPKFTNKQSNITEELQKILKDIQVKIIAPLQLESLNKMGPAFRTTFCVVGKDMQKAISIFEQVLGQIKLNKISSKTELCFEVEYLSDNLYQSLGYADSEGIIEGTLIDIYKKLAVV